MHFIHRQRANYPVKVLCAALELSRSAYYRWAKQPDETSLIAASVQRNQEINRLTIQQFHDHKKRYGTRRMVAELADLGYRVGRDGVRPSVRSACHSAQVLCPEDHSDAS